MSTPVDNNEKSKGADPQPGGKIGDSDVKTPADNSEKSKGVDPQSGGEIGNSAVKTPADNSEQSKVVDPQSGVKIGDSDVKTPIDNSEHSKGMDPKLGVKTNISDVKLRAVKVSGISLAATKSDVKEFFSFSGNIQHVELQRESEKSQVAYVTFKNSQGAETALLLSGSNIRDHPVTIAPVDNDLLLPPVLSPNSEARNSGPDSTMGKAEDVVSSMLAKGYILGKDALNKAKAFDEQHRLTSNASATVASLDRKMGLMEKISIGTAVVNEKARVVDEKYQVSEKTKSAFAAAEQKASSASTAIMSNEYVSSGASWVSGAFNKVARVAEGVSLMTKEKVEKAEEKKEYVGKAEETKEVTHKERPGMVVNDFSQLHLDETPAKDPPAKDPPAKDPPAVPLDNSVDHTKSGNKI